MDIVVPLPISHNGFKYILILEDGLSKFIVAVPLFNEETHTVDEFLG